MTGFGLVQVIRLKGIKLKQVSLWSFGNFFVPFGIPKMIVGDTYGIFGGIFKNNFQDTLLIPVHSVARVNHRLIRKKGFHCYLNKFHNIK